MENLGLLRKKNIDFKLSRLLDAILDNYLETIGQINDEILIIEKQAFNNNLNERMGLISD